MTDQMKRLWKQQFDVYCDYVEAENRILQQEAWLIQNEGVNYG